MKYCTVVCVIFLFVCLVTIFLFWIFEPRARRVSVIIISSVVCVVVFIYILRPIVGFPPPPHPSLIVFFFFFCKKTKQKWICYYSASVCESDCLKYYFFLWEFALECRQKQSNGYRLLIIMVRNPALPAIFFSVCVCVIVFECLAML